MKFRYKKYGPKFIRPVINLRVSNSESEPFYIHEIWLDVGRHKFKSYAGFKRGLKNSYGIAGQIGFFDEFVVKFDLLKEEIELEERK